MRKYLVALAALLSLSSSIALADEWSGKFVKFTCMPEVDYMELTTVDLLFSVNMIEDPEKTDLTMLQKKYNLYFVDNTKPGDPIKLDFDCSIAGHTMSIHLRYGRRPEDAIACVIIRRDKKVLTAFNAFQQTVHSRYAKIISADKVFLYLNVDDIAPMNSPLFITEVEKKPEFSLDGKRCLKVE